MGTTVVIIVFAVLALFFVFVPMGYLLVDTIIDIRDTSKKRKQIEKEIEELHKKL